jgi:hypothetical protein
MGPGFAGQESMGRVFGQIWNRINSVFPSKPGLLASYLDQLLPLLRPLYLYSLYLKITFHFLHSLCNVVTCLLIMDG